jgi:succinate-semialdehyde dehydrogenase/glutarate-semialdehyde dehydrogenase
MSIQSINPYNGRVLKTIVALDDHAIRDAIEKTHQAYLSWKKTSITTRSRLMVRLADELLHNKTIYARIITLEMGKVIRESIAEIEKCAAVCRYYADRSPSFLSNEKLETPTGKAYIHYEPLGTVLAVMPWNFPFWQVFRFAAPALMAGNAALLKHASNVPQCAMAIQSAFEAAGFPKGLFQSLMIGSDKVARVLDHPAVCAATLTGSEKAGEAVAERAGRLLKKTVMELGGSDPFIVLKSANLDLASATGVKARMINTGQSCIAAKRFIIESAIYKPFLQSFIKTLHSLEYGDPMYESSDYGPMARHDLALEIHEQVQKSLDMGAKLLYGTPPDDVDDAHYPPLILGGARPGMPAYDEEIFGPVAVFFEVENADEAVRIANDSAFGLGASVWSEDLELAQDVAHRVETGAVYINQLMFSDPHVPFGGIKKSGYGRELSHLGIREFTNQKTVWLAD